MSLPHFGFSLYCSICYQIQGGMHDDCGCLNKTNINSNCIDYKEVLLRRKIFLRMKKLKRING